MAIGTVTIAFCPTYAAIGVAAPVIVLIGRLLQGFSAGVELGGVSVYLSEIATPGNKGFYTSFQSSSQQVAIFVASPHRLYLERNDPGAKPSIRRLEAKWRIPFFIGCLIIPFIFFLRRTLEETPEFLAMKKHPTTSGSLRFGGGKLEDHRARHDDRGVDHHDLLLRHRLHPDLRQDSAEALLDATRCWSRCLVAVTNFIWNPVGGALSDRIGRKPVLLAIAMPVALDGLSGPALAGRAIRPSARCWRSK